jgi:hypothetical protein
MIFGAIDFAAALSQVGSFLGSRVTVCDARALFATSRRFPFADEVVVDWPYRYLVGEVAADRVDGRTAIAVLTHGPKFDVPVLEIALRLPEVGYLGAMGSRRTHLDRMLRLQEAGVTESELARLCSPIGLDLGARTPQETAISIAAEIIAGHQGGSGRPLAAHDGPIHQLRSPDDRPPTSAPIPDTVGESRQYMLGEHRTLVEQLIDGGPDKQAAEVVQAAPRPVVDRTTEVLVATAVSSPSGSKCSGGSFQLSRATYAVLRRSLQPTS